MNSFMHIMLNGRGTTLEIMRKGKQEYKIVIDGGIGERIVIELSNVKVEDLKLTGLRLNFHD